MSDPLVSIITPSFNQAAYIRATIDSVLSQNYPNLEYFVIDAASTDGTVEILKSYDDPRLKWVSEPDRGQSDAINKGLKWAQGDFIAYLNSDDLLLPAAVSFTVNAFQQNPAVDLIYGDCLYIDGQGSQTGVIYGQPFDIRQVLMGRIFLPQQTTFWRKSATDKIGLFDETLHYTMDVDYWLRLFVAGFNLQYVSGIRGAYRLHSDSKTVTQVEGFWRDWDRMIEHFLNLPQLAPEILQMQSDKNYLWMYTLYAPWKQGYRTELRPLLKKVITGPVPLKHRLLALVMYLDTYLHTSFSNKALSLVARTQKAPDS